MSHSMIPTALPALPVAVPLMGAAILAALRKWLPRWLGDSFAIAVAAVTCWLCSSMLIKTVLHGNAVYWLGGWYPRGSMALGIGLFLDPVGTALAALAALLTLLALIFS